MDKKEKSPQVNSKLSSGSKVPFSIGYEIFVRSFADGSGDGIGDFSGLLQKLDYVADLGADAIWLMPVNSSPSYHGYDVTDYFGINPHYGTKAQFRELVDEAHKRGIKVLMDLVLNHTSVAHPWFKQSVMDRKSPFRRYYDWKPRAAIERHIMKEQLEEDSDNPIQWHPYKMWRGKYAYTSDYYYAYFWEGMPDLDYSFRPVRQKAKEIGRYWIEEFGVDGFRLDAAKHIFPDHRHKDNVIWWEEFRSDLEKVNPNVWLLGEVWDEPEVVSPYFKGLHSLFNFHLAYQILEAVKSGKAGNLVNELAEVRAVYAQNHPSFSDTIFLTNHDQDRGMSQLEGSDTKMRLAVNILFSLPGIIFLYYGEELGMLGSKPDIDIRRPFPWGKRDAFQACWHPSQQAELFTIASAQEQMEIKSSLYHHYKKLISFRKENGWLTTSAISVPDFELPDCILGVERIAPDGNKWVFLHNLSDKKIEMDLPKDGFNQKASFPELTWEALNSRKVVLDGARSLVVSNN